jgi:hypothetical protein
VLPPADKEVTPTDKVPEVKLAPEPLPIAMLLAVLSLPDGPVRPSPPQPDKITADRTIAENPNFSKLIISYSSN